MKLDEVLKWLDEAKDQMQPIWARMDEDENLYFLRPFRLRAPESVGGYPISDVENVTLAKPLVYAKRLMSTLMAATMQIEVATSDGKDMTAQEIEDLIVLVLRMADRRLQRIEIMGLYPYLCEHICVRGYIAARCTLREEDGCFIPDIMPCDTRHFVWQSGHKGLLRAASFMTRDRWRVKEEYGVDVRDRTVEVIDYWDREQNLVIIDGQVVRSQENVYGYVPFVVSSGFAGTMLSTLDARKHWGESIFHASRHTYEYLNKLATIAMTLARYCIDAPLAFISETGDVLPNRPIRGIGQVIALKQGEQLVPVPLEDLNKAMAFISSYLEGDIQKATISDVSQGKLDFPLSSLTLAEIAENRSLEIVPRLQSLESFYSRLMDMIVSQLSMDFSGLLIDDTKVKMTYKPKVLDNYIGADVKLTVVTPSENIANLSVAAAQDRWLDSETILRNTLMVDNPSEMARRKSRERAEMVSPALFRYRRIMELLGQEPVPEHEAAILAAELGVTLEQIKAGQFGRTPEKEPAVGPIPLIPEEAAAQRAKVRKQEKELEV